MKLFEKSHKLDNVYYDVRGPVVEEAARMTERGEDILKLNIGNPAPFGLLAPEPLIRDMGDRLVSAEGYSDSKGLPAARQAIVEYCKFKGIPNVGVGDVYTGNGVSELIIMSMQALLNPGDEMLVPSPDYPLWTAAVNLSGGTAVHYVCDEQSDWNPDIDDIREKITPRTKGIIVINPNNPTGALYETALLEQIVELARQNDLIIFCDEIYDRLVMDGLNHVSIASLAPDLFMVTMNGLSKSHKMAGFRCGWMCLSGDKSRMGGYIEGLNMLSSMRLCSNVPAQLTIPGALADAGKVDSTLLPGGRIYDQREFITNALNSIPGVHTKKPKAAFYIFPGLDAKRFHIHDDERFALDFLHEQHVLVVHGTGFNWIHPDHFRVVFLPDVNHLKTATDRLGEFLSHYRQQ